MEYNSFENQIKKTLLSETHLVDIDALNKAIHAKKDNRRYLWLFLFLGTAVALMVSYFTFSSRESAIPINIEANSAPQTTAINNGTTVSENHSTKIEGSTTMDQQILSTNEPIHNDSNDKIKVLSNLSKNNKANIEKYNNKNTTSNYSPNISIFTKDPIEVNVLPSAENTLNNAARESIHLIRLSSIASTIHTSKIILFGKDDIKCPNFKNKSNFKFALIPEVGLVIPQKTLANNFGESSSLLDLRRQNETSQLGYQAAFYGLISKPGLPFSIKAGLSYTNFAERMKLNYNYTKIDTTIGIISITKSQTGDTITTIYGDIVHERKITGSKTIHHTISSVDIPIGINYEKSIGDFTLSGGVGIYLNLSTSISGHLLATDTSFVAIAPSASLYRKNVGVSYYGELLVMRPIGNIGTLYIGGRYRNLPQSYSSAINNIKQSYGLISINLGYIYTF